MTANAEPTTTVLRGPVLVNAPPAGEVWCRLVVHTSIIDGRRQAVREVQVAPGPFRDVLTSDSVVDVVSQLTGRPANDLLTAPLARAIADALRVEQHEYV